MTRYRLVSLSLSLLSENESRKLIGRETWEGLNAMEKKVLFFFSSSSFLFSRERIEERMMDKLETRGSSFTRKQLVVARDLDFP